MSAVAFDSLEYAHQLEAVGMPREQAEVVAKGVTRMFIHNFDTLVTRDYLDTRFTEFETRIEAKMDRRFADFRLEVLGETSELRGMLRLHSWMLSIVIAVTLLPLVQNWLG
ncbi:MAG: hypothetical protein H6991_09950 [Pseudomonadales bacterium]|nr:hypothetical protein [Pseudomonadales bacterium]MCP5188080.1 hypothetical protein [Pseudomonadales bacterium]